MNDRIDLLAPENRGNPYAAYARLRRERPVCQVEPGGIWVVTRYADVQHVLKHPALFSSGAFQAAFQPDWLPHNPIGDSLFTMDPPRHGKLRALVSRAFTSRSIARLEPFMRATAAEQADRLRDLDEVDFVNDFTMPFPARVISEILGLDPALYRELQRWSLSLVAVTAPPTEKIMRAARETVAEMEGYLSEVIRERRRAPKDDVVSDLVRAEVDGHALTDAEIMAFLFLLIPAGFDTTNYLLANTMRGFLARPGDMAALHERPETIPAYIEEMLRHDPPVQALFRVATEDVDMAGATIPAGATVLALIASATRDEERFADPERFDPSRANRPGDMAFGHGIHFCLGAPLARLEARIGLEALVARFRDAEAPSDELDWIDSLSIRGPKALPLRLVPA